MDDDRRELIVRLCTAAGMLMKDISTDAIVLSRLDDTALTATVDRLVGASTDISAIVSAAAALARPRAD